MKKAILITVILILLSGCAIEQPKQEPISVETESIESGLEETFVEEELTPEPIVEIMTIEEPEQPQIKPTEPPIAPQNHVTEPTPARISEPPIVSNPQTANQSTTPQAPPSQTPEPKPVYEPVPEPATTEKPTPPPAPIPAPPLVVSPPPARTICNTCGADITGNVPAHGTTHLLAGENFSYRVE